MMKETLVTNVWDDTRQYIHDKVMSEIDTITHYL